MSKLVKTEFASSDTSMNGDLVIFTDESMIFTDNTMKFLPRNFKDYFLKNAAIEKFTGKEKTYFSVTSPEGLSCSRLIIVGTGTAENKEKYLRQDAWQNLGGFIAPLFKAGQVHIFAEIPNVEINAFNIAQIALGVHLRNYKFQKYKTGNKVKEKADLSKLIILTPLAVEAKKAYKNSLPIIEGTILARNLVNEPANILFPEEFAKRASELKKLGVEIDILGEKALKKAGFSALLAVGQGSKKESFVVVMRWNGGKPEEAPLAFIGKGVCFDSGGISIKPSASMEDMKGDMGGAACVTGLMHALASRKAKANIVAAIGLVENMPDGAAQRPGDIVTSLSGQTIEVINTDAEGRMVLADLLWYVQKEFSPKFMINLATLTGAIMVALGQDYAGLFSNNDTLANQISESGRKTGEKVWRMPLNTEHDKAIDSKFADMKNSAGRFAGSCTAAAFLKRYVNDVCWAHLDIAGTAMGSPQSDINESWGSGWGVQLLDNLVREYYE